ncbi:MAG: glycosyltransferase family 2 protein [Candidatus Scalinduaceae bacterium]
MICSICIATYKRPKLLKDLLNSLVAQVISEDVGLEIIIVDNDPAGSGESVYKKFSNTKQFEFLYFIQPIKNISLTRNMAVKKATGEYILFIDDDEVASPEWVTTLLKTIKDFDADGVFGRVISNVNNKASEWIKRNYLFNRPSSATGTEAISTRTGNCIVKASLLKGVPGPFDPTYGLTGGSDSHLFYSLRQKGAKFVNCYEAWVSEFVPPERTRISWLLRRAFRKGNTYTRKIIDSAGKRRRIIKVTASIRAICLVSINLFLIFIASPSKIWQTHWTLKTAEQLGRFFAVFGCFYQEYK